jgi:hypothetical protein
MIHELQSVHERTVHHYTPWAAVDGWGASRSTYSSTSTSTSTTSSTRELGRLPSTSSIDIIVIRWLVTTDVLV